MRCRELVATDEPAVVTELLFDPIVVEDGQDDGRLADPASADEGDWRESFCDSNNLLGQLVASKEDPRWWRRWFPRHTRCKRKILNSSVTEIADLF